MEVAVAKYYSSWLFKDVVNTDSFRRNFAIPSNGLYVLRITNLSGKKQNFSLRVLRLPAEAAPAQLDSQVQFSREGKKILASYVSPILVRHDTVVEMIEKDTQIWVRAKTHYSCISKEGSCNKEFIRLIFPPYTYRWAYYLVVGQENKDKLEQSIRGFLKTGATLISYLSPKAFLLAQLAKGIIDALPTLSGNSSIYYFFCDKYNFQKFITHKESYQPLAEMKYGSRITDYGLVQHNKVPAVPIYLCLENQALLQGVEVFVTVIAMRAIPIYTIEQQKIEFKHKKWIKEYLTF
ncbi:MAG: hypothetical protein RML72_08010 [Bacteroidia bacterium]|nr:hypothetical protein [Bacteroidia bacterium]MDW8158803.1 hypothetical protein [Bacteroidia bacterium]